jgi:hypothetical protein
VVRDARFDQPRLFTKVSPSLVLFVPSGQIVLDHAARVEWGVATMAKSKLASVRVALIDRVLSIEVLARSAFVGIALCVGFLDARDW